MLGVVTLSALANALAVIGAKFALSRRKSGGFLFGAIAYTVIGLGGMLIGWYMSAGSPVLDAKSIYLLAICAIGFPLAGITSYYMVKLAGAGNAAVLMVVHYLFLAAGARIFLGDVLSGFQIAGAVVLMLSVFFATIASHGSFKKASLITISIALLNGLCYFFATPAEKVLISNWGYAEYASISLPLQAVGSWVLLFIAALATDIKLYWPTKREYKWSAFSGICMLIGGLLYIYALSNTSLSQAGLASSLKIIIVAVLSIILFKETSRIWLRMSSLALSISGLLLLFS